jgi:hypothetical protein
MRQHAQHKAALEELERKILQTKEQFNAVNRSIAEALIAEVQVPTERAAHPAGTHKWNPDRAPNGTRTRQFTDYIQSHPKTTVNETAAALGVTISNARSLLNRCVEKKMVTVNRAVSPITYRLVQPNSEVQDG